MTYILLYNYWIVLALLLFARFIFSKSLSSYNIKWLVLYLVYVLLSYAEYEFDYKSIVKYNEVEEVIWVLFLVPLCAYLLFPGIYQHIKGIKVIKWIDDRVDSVYNKIKELS